VLLEIAQCEIASSDLQLFLQFSRVIGSPIMGARCVRVGASKEPLEVLSSCSCKSSSTLPLCGKNRDECKFEDAVASLEMTKRRRGEWDERDSEQLGAQRDRQ
jgi:hypothetical protein